MSENTRNNKRIIYISWSKLTDRISRDYFLNFLRENSIDVEFWDVGEFTRPHFEEYGSLNPDYLRNVKNYDEFKTLVREFNDSNTIFISLITVNWQARRLFRILSKNKCKVVFINWGMMPIVSTSKWRRIFIKLFKSPLQFLKLLLEIALMRVYRMSGLIKSFDIVFNVGNKPNSVNTSVKKTVPINSIDFEHFSVSRRARQSPVSGPYAVFLDINLPFQSDFNLGNVKPVNAESYYTSLNKFLSKVEDKFGIDVVIAAHPKTSIDLHHYGDRVISRLRTAEFVRDASFVITHHSTSLSYAVLNYKPCIFVYTREMEVLYPNGRVRAIKSLANYLDASIYNVDEVMSADQITLKSVSRSRYDSYKYSFLVSKTTEQLSSHQIFLDELINL